MENKTNTFVWYEQEVIDQCVDESLGGLDMKLGTPRTCPIKQVVD